MLRKIINILVLRDVYLTNRFFVLFGGITILFTTSFLVPILMPVAQALLLAAISLVIVDMFLLFNRGVVVECERELPRQLSLGDDNKIFLHIHNRYGLGLNLSIIDELPVEFQKRDFEINFT